MKHILVYILAAAAAWGCTGASNDPAASGAPSYRLLRLLADESPQANPYDSVDTQAPDDGCQRIYVAPIGPLRRVFNDSNHVHLQAAEAIGFEPVGTSADILSLSRPVVRIESCQAYYVEPLTHSFPYLVPQAAALLDTIGTRFGTLLGERGGGAYRIKVTSVTRTPATVRRLRRVNRNATDASVHQYGTTFDISYSKFICDDPSQPHRTFEDLKNLLAEVLYELRAQGKCYVKYEVKQSCFHITVR